MPRRTSTGAGAAREAELVDLYRALAPGLHRYVSSRLRGNDAEDVVSQVWYEVVRAQPDLADEDERRAFVYTVARRRIQDELRRQRRKPVDLVDQGVLDGMLGTGTDPGSTVADRLDGEAAARRIAGLLPEEQADIVLLRVVGGLSADEVAAVVGRPAGTVRVLQHRALRRLAEMIPAPL